MAQLAVSTNQEKSVSTEEWEARVNLAAAYRYAELRGWSISIFNHFTARVPGSPGEMLVKPHELTFGEVTAGSLLKVPVDGGPTGSVPNVNAAVFTIHTAVLSSRTDVHAVCHLHSRAGSAVAALESGFRCLTQESMMFYDRIAYHDFEGIADASDERARIARDLGSLNTMILRNHGLLTCGPTIEQALIKLEILIESAEVQLLALSTGQELLKPSPEVCERTAQQFEGFQNRSGNKAEWDAVLRLLDRTDPTFRN